MSSENVPSGEFSDESYVSRPGQKQDPIPVTSDNAPVESGVNAETADSEEQLGEFSLFPETVPETFQASTTLSRTYLAIANHCVIDRA